MTIRGWTFRYKRIMLLPMKNGVNPGSKHRVQDLNVQDLSIRESKHPGSIHPRSKSIRDLSIPIPGQRLNTNAMLTPISILDI
jgi:hypothetical protein